MDLNGDGLKDILTGSFSGAPQWIKNTKDGYSEPSSVVEKDGDIVMLTKYWSDEAEKWLESERSGTDGQCTSVAAVDWDHDGDMDLILGDYWDGGLFLCLNEGSATDMKFASTNQVIKVGGEPIVFEGGMGGTARCRLGWRWTLRYRDGHDPWTSRLTSQRWVTRQA